MSGYTKLFSDIVDSSIWREPSDIRVVWITLLALSDQDGYVRGSVGWLAAKSGVAPEMVERALDSFMAPDPSSRTTDNEGRRIEQLEDGWLVLNYLQFRDRLSDDQKAKKSRERVRKHRESHKALRNAGSVTGDVSVSVSVYAFDSVIPEWLKRSEGFGPELWNAWMDTRKKKRATMSDHAVQLLIRKLAERPADAVKAVETAVLRGWQGFEWEWMDGRKSGYGGNGNRPDGTRHGEFPSNGNRAEVG